MKRLTSLLATSVLLAAAWTFISADPASAQCHMVSISASPNPVEEKDTSVAVTITRSISQAGCTANINYTTSDGTANDPADYSKRSGHCTEFDANPLAPQCTFTVPIKHDEAFEGNETFTASFSGTSNGQVAITIQDNDASPPPPVQSPKPTPATSPTQQTTSPSPTASPTPESPSPEASPTESPSPLAKTKDDDGGAPVALIVAIIAFVLGGGAGLGLWLLRKTPA